MRSLRRSDVVFLILLAASVVGVFLNPLLTTWWEQYQTILAIVALLALTAVSLEILRSRRGDVAGSPVAIPIRTTLPAAVGFWMVVGAWAILYRLPWSHFHLFADDYRYLVEAGANWREGVGNVLLPFNEHVVVTTRLITALFVHFGDLVSQRIQPEGWCAVVSVTLFLVTAALLFEFLRQTWGELPALVGVALFTVSICHAEVVLWYSAAQWLIPASLLIGALLLVNQPGLTRLLAATLLATFAPWNYTIGALVGPFTTLWLFSWHRRRQWRSLLPTIAGIASTLFVLVIVRRAMSRPGYWESGGRGMIEAFSPWMGLIDSARLFVDRLLLTNLGYRGLPASLLFDAAVVAALAVVVIAALRRTPSLARLWPVASLIVIGYGMTIPFRTWQPYESLVDWNRYQLIPHLGMSMLAAGVVGSFPANRAPLTWRRLFRFIVALCLWTLLQRRTFR